MEAYFRLQSTGQEPAAKEVRLEAMRLCVADNIQVKPFPTVRTVQYIVQHQEPSTKKTDDARSPDTLWSMGSLKDFPVSETSIPGLLKAWKASVALYQPFTNRDAIWAARLSTFISDTRLLYFWSKLYSLKERVAESLGQDFDSTFLDSCLVTADSWDIPMALITTGASQLTTLFGYPRPRTLKIGVDNADKLAAYVERFYFSPDPTRDTERDNELRQAIIELPSLPTLGFTEGSIWLYMYWLNKLYLGPKWPDKPAKEAFGLIQRLREWVSNHPNNKQEYMKERDPADRGTDVIQELLGDPMPWQILSEVGYKNKSMEEEAK